MCRSDAEAADAADLDERIATLVSADCPVAVDDFCLCLASFGVVMNSVYSVIHEAEHGMLLRGRRVNDVMGVAMALFFPAPFHLLRQGHIGHHLRNRSDDEAFDLWFEGESPVWKRVQLYGILTGFYWLVVVAGNVVVLLAPGLLTRRLFEFDRPSRRRQPGRPDRTRTWLSDLLPDSIRRRATHRR